MVAALLPFTTAPQAQIACPRYQNCPKKRESTPGISTSILAESPENTTAAIEIKER